MPSRPKRGLSLVELTLSMAIFGLLLGSLFLIFRAGSLAWSRQDTNLDLFQASRAVMVRWSNEFLESNAETVLATGASLSFASARQLSGGGFAATSPAMHPLWQKYLLYYRDPASREMRRRELSLSSPTQTIKTLVDYDFGSGPQALATYTSGGEVLLKDVEAVDFAMSGGTCTLILTTHQSTYGSAQGQLVRLQCSARCNN